MTASWWNRREMLVAAAASLAVRPAAAAMPLRVAYPSGMNGQIPVVMERAAIAPKHGFDAEYTMFQNGPPMMEALASGGIDAVITSLMPVTSFIARQPGRAQIVAQLGASSHSLMVGKDSKARSVADLKGRRLAVSFATDSHLDLLRLLRQSRLEPGRDVTLVNTPPNELMLALSQNFADAILVRVPQVERMEQQFGARVVHTWPFRFVAIMRSEYLREQPQARAMFNAALADAVVYTATHRALAAAWFAERLRLDPQIVLRATGTDPLFDARRPADVPLAITPAYESLLAAWAADALDFGLIKTAAPLLASVAR